MTSKAQPPADVAETLFDLCAQTLVDGGLSVAGLTEFLTEHGHEGLLDEAYSAIRGKIEASGPRLIPVAARQPSAESAKPPSVQYKVLGPEDWWSVGDWLLGVPFGRPMELAGVEGVLGEEGRVVHTYWGKPKRDEHGAPLVEHVAIVRHERVSPGGQHKALTPIAPETLDKTLREMGVKPPVYAVPDGKG